MRINQKRRPRFKPLHIAAAAGIILAIAAAVTAYFLLKPSAQKPETNQPNPIDTVNYDPPAEEDKQEATQNKIETTNPKPDDPTPTSPPESQSLTVTISRAGQLGKGQPLEIRTQIDGTTSGTCYVQLTRDGQTIVTASFSIAFEATSAICRGDIPANQFGASGDWQLTISAKNGNLSSPPVSQTVTIDL